MLKSRSFALEERLVADKADKPEKVDLSNLPACTRDARDAALDSDRGPPDPTEYSPLRGRLEASRDRLPPLYQRATYEPYLRALDGLGERGFTKILVQDPERERLAGLMLDIAQAILQNGDGYASLATDAFQEVVSDLYDGFLSAEDRRGVKPPDHGKTPPLVKWGNPDFGPYTWPVTATEAFGVKAPVVSLPPANARRGLLAWSALGHETAGHDLLGADDGLREEITSAVRSQIAGEKLAHGLPDYWADRIDETASDVLGILNMGPAAAVGLIGYFRGLNEAWGSGPKLRSVGPESDPHPADIVRGWLAAEVVALLAFRGAAAWSQAIAAETDKDATRVVLAGEEVPREVAKKSAAVVARAIVRGRMRSLEDHALGDIQDWRDRDQRVVAALAVNLTTVRPLASRYASGIYAAHVVAAAVTAAAGGADTAPLFGRMLAMLKTMHDANPSWGPLYVSHPGDIDAHVLYVPTVLRDEDE